MGDVVRFRRRAIPGGLDPVAAEIAPVQMGPGETNLVYSVFGISLGVHIGPAWRSVIWPPGWTRYWWTDDIAVVVDVAGRPRVRIFATSLPPHMDLMRRYRIEILGGRDGQLTAARVRDLATGECPFYTPYRGGDDDVAGEAIAWLHDHDPRWDSPLAWAR